MIFKDMDGGSLEVRVGLRTDAVFVDGRVGSDFAVLAFDPDTADEIASALIDFAADVRSRA